MIGYLPYSTTVWEKLNRATAEPGARREREKDARERGDSRD